MAFNNRTPVLNPQIGKRVFHDFLGSGTIVHVDNFSKTYLVKYDNETHNDDYDTYSVFVETREVENCWLMKHLDNETDRLEIAYYEKIGNEKRF